MNFSTKEKNILRKLRNLTSHKELDDLIAKLETLNKLLSEEIRFQYAFFHFNYGTSYSILSQILAELCEKRMLQVQVRERYLYALIHSSILLEKEKEAYELIAGLYEPLSPYASGNLAKQLKSTYETYGTFKIVFEKQNLIPKRDNDLKLIDLEKHILKHSPKLHVDYGDFRFASEALNLAIQNCSVKLIKEVFLKSIDVMHFSHKTLIAARILAYAGDLETAKLVLRNYIKSWSGESLSLILPINLIYDPYLKEIITEDFLQEVIFTPKQEYIIYKK